MSIKNNIICDIYDCGSFRRNVNEDLLKMYCDLADALDYLDKPFCIKDFSINGNQKGVKREIELVLKMIDKYHADFYELFSRYKILEGGE